MKINEHERFIKKYEQRKTESIIQFVNIINPQSAAEFIRGVHQANELVHDLKTDTLLIAQRGGSFFDIAMKEFDRLLNRRQLKTIYLPIGVQRDIRGNAPLRIPSIEEKIQIVEQVVLSDGDSNLGNLTFVEEAKSGSSVTVFLEHILPILKTKELSLINIILMIDRGSPIDLDRSPINKLRKKYDVQIHEIVTSLAMSDKKSLTEELISDPESEGKIPKTLSNEIVRSFIKLLSISALYPNELLDLLNDYFLPESDLNKMRNLATSKLTEPGYINNWLMQYQREIIK